MATAATREAGGPDHPSPGSGISADWTLAHRLRWLARFRRELVANREELAGCANAEVGKDRFETLVSDIAPLAAACRWHERRARGLLRPRRLGGGSVWQVGQRHWIHREPLGLVGIIATWNYPIQLLGVQLVQALVAGNRVVVKPSERCPRTQGRLLELADRAGTPGGALRALGHERDAGAMMLRDEPLDHVVFTGSTAVGIEVASALAGRLVPSTLELSGRDSAIVLEDADAGLAAAAIASAVRLNAGQTCMAPRRVLCVGPIADAVLDRLSAALADGPALVMCDDREAARVRALSGAGGEGASVRPMVAVCGAGDPLVEGEHFGPVVALVRCTSEGEALALHRARGQHLATSVFTRDIARARRLAPELCAGTVTINDAILPTAHPGAPLPARARSGWGVTRGAEGLLAMTRPLHVSTTSRRVRAPASPPPPAVAARLDRFVGWWYGR